MSDQGQTPKPPGAFRIVLTAPHRSSGLLQHRIEQLVRDAIADGVLQEGDQLPPYRVAAATSRLRINTILNAYRALIRDELLRSVPGRGYFIGGPIRPRGFFAGCAGDCSCVRPMRFRYR